MVQPPRAALSLSSAWFKSHPCAQGAGRAISRPSWTRKEWEDYCLRLLQHRYAIGELQPVPSFDRGDYGIEAFSTDGCAYQCYAAEALSTAALYKAQRGKMNDDLKKFVRNQAGFKKLLGDIIVQNWIFLVPELRSKQLIEYAAGKQQEIRNLQLPYADPEFRITILTDDAFARERALLIHSGAQVVHLPELPVPPATVDAWLGDPAHDPLSATLADKISRIPTLATVAQREMFRREMIRRFITGQNLLEQVRSYSPETWEDIVEVISSRENVLRTDQVLSGHPPTRFLEHTRSDLVARFGKRAPGLSGENLDTLALEAIAEWMVRCPLDFE